MLWAWSGVGFARRSPQGPWVPLLGDAFGDISPVHILPHHPRAVRTNQVTLGASDGPYSCWVTLGWDIPVVVPRGPGVALSVNFSFSQGGGGEGHIIISASCLEQVGSC